MRRQTLVPKPRFGRALALLLALALLVPLFSVPAVRPDVARADTSATAKIDRVLLDQTAADPAKLLPIVVEMNAAQAPFGQTPAPNEQLAQTPWTCSGCTDCPSAPWP